MNNWYDSIEFSLYQSENMAKLYNYKKFVEKATPKIIESQLLNFIREPKRTIIKFNYFLDINLVNHVKQYSDVVVLIKDWRGDVVDTVFNLNKSTHGILQYNYTSIYGDLFTFEICSITKEPMLLKRFGSVFYENTLPTYLLKFWGIAEGTLVYSLLEEKIKNKINNLIEYNEYYKIGV